MKVVNLTTSEQSDLDLLWLFVSEFLNKSTDKIADTISKRRVRESIKLPAGNLNLVL